jgi:type II secretion system protein E
MLISSQQEEGGSLLRKCLEVSGRSEDAFLPVLADAMSLPRVEPAGMQPPPEILALLPAKVVYQLKVLPLHLEKDGVLRVVTHDPFRFGMLETLQVCSGHRIRLGLAPLAEVEQAIKKLYGVGGETIEQLLESADESEVSDLLDADPDELDEEASVVKFVNQIIWEAREEGATDIHMEPMEKDLRIRYRIDGVLVPVALPPRLKRFQAAILSRLKVMANMDIAEKRLPQDGRIGLRIRGEDVDIRVSTMPTVYGESISLRLLMRNTTLMGMEKLGLCEADAKQLGKLITRPHGILLVTGPTGSGKSTSLYTYLSSINSVEKRIITCEDPIEYEIPGINQIQMKPEIGLNFAVSLRHILRQDPDVIMIGEIRDFDTSEIAVQAALTGHLVFSTLHTNDAASGFTRLLDMGVEPFLVASSLEALVAQRLVRTLCPDCKKPAEYTAEDLRAEGFRVQDRDLEEATLYQAQGCEACRKTGYRGRTGIYEILTVTDEIRQMVIAREPAGKIKQLAIRQGMTPLREDGWKKVRAGRTTIEEVIRVTEEDAEE